MGVAHTNTRLPPTQRFVSRRKSEHLRLSTTPDEVMSLIVKFAVSLGFPTFETVSNVSKQGGFILIVRLLKENLLQEELLMKKKMTPNMKRVTSM